MMNKIRAIITTVNPSYEALIEAFEMVKNNGDVGIIKFDGARAYNYYTVFISFPNDLERGIIRADGDDLKIALIKVLDLYSR